MSVEPRTLPGMESDEGASFTAVADSAPKRSFLKYLYSTDHEVIGLLYGLTSLVVLLVGFSLVVLIRWQLACSQLCGLGHYRMRGFYTIQTEADYDAWLAEEAALLATP